MRIRMRARVLLLVLLIVGWIGLTLPLQAHAHMNGWLDGWQYRKEHSITDARASSENLTNYQIRIKTCYGSGTDSGEYVYLDEHSRTDFGDVRFTKSDGETLLDYWIEEIEGGDESIPKAISGSYIASNGTIFAGADDTLYKSIDGGKTWTALKQITNASDMQVFVNSKDYVFFSPGGKIEEPISNNDTGKIREPISSNDTGLWRSIDGGKSWSHVLSLDDDTCNIWGIDEDSDGNIYAGVYTIGETSEARIYKSADDGSTWSSVYYNESFRHIHDVKVDKSNNYVYAAYGDDIDPWYTEGIIRSTDGGETWSEILSELPQITKICITPNARVFGTDQADVGRIYRTTDDSSASIVLDLEYVAFVFWMQRNPDTGNIYAGFIKWDSNAGIYKSEDDGHSWTQHKELSASSTGDGSDYGSNFVNGEMLYSVRTDGNYQNGMKLHDPISLSYRATFWVEVDNIPANPNTTTIYVYYGKIDATTTSNGDDTFDFFDDFSGDLSKWTIKHYDGNGSASIVGGWARVNSEAGGDFWDSQDGGSGVFKATPLNDNYAIETVFRQQNYPASDAYNTFLMSRANTNDNSAFYTMLFDDDSSHITTSWRDQAESAADWAGENTGWNRSSKTTFNARLVKLGSAFYAYVSPDGNTWYSVGSISGSYHGYTGLVDSYHDGYTEFDWVRVRKYVEPEPSHDSWGDEEASSIVITERARPLVALHVSENTKAHWNSSVGWEYFQIYTLLEEAFTSDGTPFVLVSDSDIESGVLVFSDSGVPRYPIMFSLATESASDLEAQRIAEYVNAGGFVYVGASSWTKTKTGVERPNFALSTQMGLDSVSTSRRSWTWMGTEGKGVIVTVDHPLVNHLHKNVELNWLLPETYQSLSTTALIKSNNHPVWLTQPTDAKVLAFAVAGNNTDLTNFPILAVKNYGLGYFIYHAELTPLAGWGGQSIDTYEYAFFRKAVEWAFRDNKLPLVRVAPWKYPYNAAIVTRHDDANLLPPSFYLAENAMGIRGQYSFLTSWIDPSIIVDNLKNGIANGSFVGSHSRVHVGPDTQSFADAIENIVGSLDDLEYYLSQIDPVLLQNQGQPVRPEIWVSPNFDANHEQSFGIIQDAGIKVSGEQNVGPYPHFTLSMEIEGLHYSYLQIPISESFNEATGEVYEGFYGSPTNVERTIDLVRSMSGVICMYDHLEDEELDLMTHYLDYAKQKPDILFTNFNEIYNWWVVRNTVSLVSHHNYLNGVHELTVNVSGTLTPEQALDVVIPGFQPVELNVTLDGSPTSAYELTDTRLKINSGTAKIVKITWRPPLVHHLDVLSSPFSGASFSLDGSEYTTPLSIDLIPANYTITVPRFVITSDTIYAFLKWEDNSTNPARTINLVTNMTIIFTYGPPVSPPNIPFEDNFNDDIIDTRLWDKLEAGASVTETNQRLEINSGGGGWTQSGLVFKDAFNLTSAIIMVDVSELDSLGQIQLQICLTKTTGSDPWAEANWYAVYKDRTTSTWVVERRVNGVWSQLATGSWAAPTGQLRVVVETGNIYFYENGNLRYSEPYGLPSYEGFIYVYHSTEYSSASTDAFDNFKTNLPILVKPTYVLGVNSTPIVGVRFTINAVEYSTPFSGSFEEGTYNVVFPTSVVAGNTVYRFVRWEDDSVDPVRTVSLMTNKTLTATYEESTTPVAFEDDFNDNTIDTRLWDKLEAGASVTETNQRLEINSGGGGWTQSGLVSKDAYDLTSAVIMVDVSELDSLGQMQLQICLTKTTGSDPWAETNWYAIYKDRTTSTWVVERKVNGVWSQLAAGGWAASTGQLRIIVEAGNIYFYENGNLRYSESYRLPSYEGFIYVYHSTEYSSASTDAFDNFKTNLPILVKPTYLLGVNSTPIVGVRFTINAVEYSTPFSGSFEEGTYNVVMPTSVLTGDTVYQFVRWEDDSTNPVRTVSLMTNKTLTATYEESTTPVAFEDDFNDNTINNVYWSTLQSGGTVAEVNGRLEVASSGAGWTQSGLVSKDAYDLTSAVIMVDVSELDSLRQMQLQICLTKTTSSDPWAETNWYAIYKDRTTSTWAVERRVNGVWSELATGSWAAPTGQLRVVVEAGNIYFYENGNLRYSEPYGLPSYEGFIYIYHSTDYSSASTDAFDNFNTNLPILVKQTYSTSMVGVRFTINAVEYSTPFSGSFEEGTYNVVMPTSVLTGDIFYRFIRWDNYSTNPRTRNPRHQSRLKTTSTTTQ